jgi:hypothetical protein
MSDGQWQQAGQTSEQRSGLHPLKYQMVLPDKALLQPKLHQFYLQSENTELPGDEA